MLNRKKYLPRGLDGKTVRSLLPTSAKGPEFVLRILRLPITVQVRLCAGEVIAERIQMFRIIVDGNAGTSRLRHDSPCSLCKFSDFISVDSVKSSRRHNGVHRSLVILLLLTSSVCNCKTKRVIFVAMLCTRILIRIWV